MNEAEMRFRLSMRLPDASEDVLGMLLNDARDTICAYTRRACVPDALEGAQLRLAVIYYNRAGIEGEASHSEGGVSRTMEGMPSDIEKQLRPWRLAIVPGMNG